MGTAEIKQVSQPCTLELAKRDSRQCSFKTSIFKGNKSFSHSSPNEPSFLFPILSYKNVLGAFWLLSGWVLCPDHGVPGLKVEPLWSLIKPVYLFEIVYFFIIIFSYNFFYIFFHTDYLPLSMLLLEAVSLHFFLKLILTN